ncbi:hypothetical protein TRFO_23994 [Tritrichomonas foetus]|uniref:Uncharacterized protein n=1 Tax=Tritrichomonas foetus TaxID=1144522 RepID=A0A1J4K9Y3_9EUKA|nr:hypothetical protein TRFO_23994 [Tritrichomonas foetus]|eukprot:OHT07720.1 hypothetical protein TRFO_23994 [Tritrichomonas foetus]
MSTNEKSKTNNQLKKKIQQLRNQNKKLKTTIAEIQNNILAEESRADQMAKAARELNSTKEKIQQQINSRAELSKKMMDQDEKNFEEAKMMYIQEMLDMKRETMYYSRLAEEAAQDLHDLENTIQREAEQLRKMRIQEKRELDAAENELIRLEQEERKLVQLFCGQISPEFYKMTPTDILNQINDDLSLINGNINTEGVQQNIPQDLNQNPQTMNQASLVQDRQNHQNGETQNILNETGEIRNENLDRQLLQLKALKERLEKTVYQCEPR